MISLGLLAFFAYRIYKLSKEIRVGQNVGEVIYSALVIVAILMGLYLLIPEIISNLKHGYSDLDIVVPIISILYIFVCGIWVYLHNRNKKETKKQLRANAIAIAKFLKDNNITSFPKEDNELKRKMHVFASSMNMSCLSEESFNELLSVKSKGYDDLYKDIKKEKENALKTMNLSGKDKRKTKLKKMLEETVDDMKYLEAKNYLAYKNAKKPEHTQWEIAAGASLAIGGTAGLIGAGMAAAEGQAQEQSNKAYNKFVEKNWKETDFYQDTNKKYRLNSMQKSNLEYELNRIDVINIDNQLDAFSYLKFSNLELKLQTEFNQLVVRVLVDIDALPIEGFSGSSNPVIDGYVYYDTYYNGELIDRNAFELPLFGISEDKTTSMQLLVLNDKNKNEFDLNKITVKFENKNTWVMVD